METRMVVRHQIGLHARPAALFVQAASKFDSEIYVRNHTAGSGPVDAKSILGVLTLGVGRGHEIGVEANGADAEQAIAELRALVENNFGEG